MAGLVQADRLKTQFAPAPVHPFLDVLKRDQSRLRSLSWLADFAFLRLALRLPLSAKDLHKQRDDRHNPPRAAGLSALLVGGELESADLEMDVGPVEDLDLLITTKVTAYQPSAAALRQNRLAPKRWIASGRVAAPSPANRKAPAQAAPQIAAASGFMKASAKNATSRPDSALRAKRRQLRTAPG